MADFTVRDARQSDLEALMALEATAFASDRLSRTSLRRLIGSDTTAFRVIAMGGGTIAGYCLLLFRMNSVVARIYSIAVAPSQRCLGLARLMLNDAERQVRRRRRRAIRLEVRRDNSPAIRLYERLGYRQIGVRRGYYADDGDALRFEKRLSINAETANSRTCGPLP